MDEGEDVIVCGDDRIEERSRCWRGRIVSGSGC